MVNVIKKPFLLIIVLLAGIVVQTHAIVYTVTNTSDAGAGSFRQAIINANGNAGLDNINFGIPAGPYVITLLSALPTITDPVVINGYTQASSSAGSPVIELAVAAGSNAGIELDPGSAGSTISGLILYGGNRGIYVNNSNGNTITGNFIGTNAAGTAVGASVIQWNCIQIDNSQNTIIGGAGGATTRNIISGSGQVGIYIQITSSGTQIFGNYIGTAKNGVNAIPNAQHGVLLLDSSNTTSIGGAAIANGNVISGNRQRGINVLNSRGVLIQNNYIGTIATGLDTLPNYDRDIDIENSKNAQILNNVISASKNMGIYMYNCPNSTITSNNVGTDVNGANALSKFGNLSDGIHIENSNYPTVTFNVSSSNSNGDGLYIQNSKAAKILSNKFGTDISGLIALGNSNQGVNIQSSDSATITSNVISANKSIGMIIVNSLFPQLTSNKVGTDVNGLNASATMGNLSQGVQVINCNNFVANQNVISSNNSIGLFILNSASPQVTNNFVGTDISGTISLGNTSQGVHIESSNNPVVTSNVISANKDMGLFIYNSLKPQVTSNKVGTDITGTVALGNSWQGVHIEQLSNYPVVTSNVISSNGNIGLYILNSKAPKITSNKIGTDLSGLNPLGNLSQGVHVEVADSATITGNVISANKDIGLFVFNSVYPQIKSNDIGANVNGANPLGTLGNTSQGIHVEQAANVVVNQNVVSSNGDMGMFIYNSLAPQITSNEVGTDIGGTIALGNTGQGIHVELSNNPLVMQNIVSKNGQNAVDINNSLNATITLNKIGTDITGNVALGNLQWGLVIENGSNNAVVTSNVASANGGIGIYANNAANLIIQSNCIGLGADKITSLGNGTHGIELDNSPNAIIGGTLVSQRNYIAANGQRGINANGSSSPTIQGNYVGTDVNGILAKGNGSDGIFLSNCPHGIIGGSVINARNISVASQNGSGILITDNSPHPIVKSNFVGVGKDGVTNLGNWMHGISLYGAGVDTAIIGGSLYIERNVCSGNGKSATGDGLRFETGPSGHHTILGNYCGVDSSGSVAIPNAWAGISLNEVDSSIIGGTGLYQANIASSNMHEGIYMRNALNNVIINNIIGTDITKTKNFGNGYVGIHMNAGNSFDNLIGGSLAHSNIIAYSQGLTDNPAITETGSGVFVNSGSNRNQITFNSIYCNEQSGITIYTPGNENIQAPVISLITPAIISGTAPGSSAGDSIHLYQNPTNSGPGPVTCGCQGEIYLGQTVIQAGGTWSFAHALGAGVTAARVTATQTNYATAHPIGVYSTSAFSNCLLALPITLTSFEVSAIGAHSALLQWSTAAELNNEEFIVQRSTDGVTFQNIGTVKGSGTKNALSSYTFTDTYAPSGIVYYKLIQIDYNGKQSNGPIKSISFSASEINIIPVSNSENVYSIATNFSTTTSLFYQVIAATGQIVAQGTYTSSAGVFEKTVNLQQLAPAVYIFRVAGAESVYVDKVIVR
jgi:parallel beta-helix repeat protein